MKLQSVVVLLSLAVARVSVAGTLFSYDFNGSNPWTATGTDVQPSTPLPVETSIEAKDVGTVDKFNTSERTGGILMSADVGEMTGKYEATFTSGLLPVTNSETNLGKLTLAFDLSVSMARPVTLRFESYDAQKRRTGALQTTIYPAAPDFYQRNAIDLSTMKPVGDGTFNPADPFVQMVFVIDAPAWPTSAKHELRLDNVHYASPAYYVSPTGKDDNDGLTETTPFLNPQKAVDLAKPGDIVLLMGGEYRRGGGNDEQNGIMHVEGAGTPAAWITFKNYPGQTPTLINTDSWCAVRVGGRVRLEKYKDSQPAYLEFRGLHVRGGADKVMELHADKIGKPLPETNGNGISGGGVRGGMPMHHLRVADCVAEYLPGGGIGFSNADWVYIENNVSRNNCWFTIYATSGFGALGTENFDTQDNVYKTLFRNNKSIWNRTYIIWKQIGKVSDGNGLIIDTTYDPAKNAAYIGRFLIQNNLCTDNGGSGIHCFKAQRVDVVNNTAFRNGASPELAWGQIFFQRTSDARSVNNVLYARGNQPVNTVGKDISDKGNTNIVRSNNVYFGGGSPPIVGTDDVVADPGFIDPWAIPESADYRVKEGSPVIGHGKWDAFVPLLDLDGNVRPLDRAPDAGAYQFQPASAK